MMIGGRSDLCALDAPCGPGNGTDQHLNSCGYVPRWNSIMRAVYIYIYRFKAEVLLGLIRHKAYQEARKVFHRSRGLELSLGDTV